MSEEPMSNPTMNLHIEFEPNTGKISVKGHIDNTDLCLKVLCEAGHIILARNADIAKKASDAAAAASKSAQNGLHVHEDPSTSKVN